MVVVRSQAEVNPPVTQQIGGVDLIGSGAGGTGQLHYRGCPGVRDGVDTTQFLPNRYLSTCWMVQRLTSRRLARSRWLTPFDRSARMYSRCRSFRLGRRPGNRPSARAFACPATERSLIEFRHHSLKASTIVSWSFPG